MIVGRRFSTFFIVKGGSYQTVGVLMFRGSYVCHSIQVCWSVRARITVVGFFTVITPVDVCDLSVLDDSVDGHVIAPFPSGTTTRFVVVLGRLRMVFGVSESISRTIAMLCRGRKFTSVFVRVFLGFKGH